MNILIIPAISGAFFNDILAILSIVCCSLLFISALFSPRLERLERIGEWGSAPLIFGTFFQFSLLMLQLEPEKIGFLLPMPPWLVSIMFAVSLFLFAGWWWLHRRAILK